LKNIWEERVSQGDAGIYPGMEYKHPAPCDLFNIMKKYGDSNTEWFIDSWFTERDGLIYR
jgi:hypothetical protein